MTERSFVVFNDNVRTIYISVALNRCQLCFSGHHCPPLLISPQHCLTIRTNLLGNNINSCIVFWSSMVSMAVSGRRRPAMNGINGINGVSLCNQFPLVEQNKCTSFGSAITIDSKFSRELAESCIHFSHRCHLCHYCPLRLILGHFPVCSLLIA